MEYKNGMTAQDIMEEVKSLASSQGFYCRLYMTLKENPDALDFLAKQKFKDSLDMIMFLEE